MTVDFKAPGRCTGLLTYLRGPSGSPAYLSPSLRFGVDAVAVRTALSVSRLPHQLRTLRGMHDVMLRARERADVP